MRKALWVIACCGSVGSVSAQTWPRMPMPERGLIAFGITVAIQGDEVFVGRTDEVPLLPMPPARAGGVHVFRAADGKWLETAQVRAADGALGDGFGASVAVEGAVLAVGAPKRREARGAVYVFERRAGRWEEVARLEARGGQPGDRFGQAVALQAGLLAVGAPGSGAGRGQIHLFTRGAAGWIEAGTLVAEPRDSLGRFGSAIVMDGEWAAVGAPGPLEGNLFGPGPQPVVGSVYLFRRGPRGFEQIARVTPSDTALGFGATLALAETRLVVGAPLAQQGRGAVYRFERGAAGWGAAGRLVADSAHPQMLFGYSVTLAGNDVLVGAPSAQGAGRVFIYREDAGGWAIVQRLAVRSVGLGAYLGSAVAARPDLAVVGAPGADFFEGAAYLYTRESAGAWREAGSLVSDSPSLEPVVGGELRCDRGKVKIFDCAGVDLLAFLPVQALGGKRGVMLNDIWGWTDPETGREYALVGRVDGTAFVDVTDPVRPVYLGELPLHQGAQPNLWRDIKVYRDHAFIVSDGAGPHGVQIFDLTQLRHVVAPPVTFRETAHYDRIFSAHNIVVNDETGFAYTVGNSMGGETCGGALHMIDIRDPKRPAFAGCYADPNTGMAKTGYTHDAQCVVYKGPDERYRGREICFNASETALGIADVTDKAAPRAISWASYPNVAYAHQGWLSEDHRYFYLDDEGDEIAGTVPRTRTIVWDVADLEDPVVVAEYLGETAASDHNQYVKGHYVYQSNYVAGLRILDVSDPVKPVEVGFFDTVPFGENVPGFAGTWSNYPFFRSGTIVVTSMREGLFVLRKREAQLVP